MEGMVSAIPPDVVIFAAMVVVFLVIGLPLITRRVFLPRRIEFEFIAEQDLTPGQTSYFAQLDASLLPMGYRPQGNWRPVNMQGRALVRLYVSEVEHAVILMNLMTGEGHGGDEHPMNYLEIMTRYADGTILTTRNTEISDVLARLPEHIIQERRGVRDPEALKKIHDGKAEELKVREPVYSPAADFEAAFHDYHDRWCAYQMEHGFLVPSAQDGDRLRPTVKTGLRGIRNFLNPLADNFTVARFALGLLFGVLLPAAGIAWLNGPGQGVIDSLGAATGLEPAWCVVGGLTLLFSLSGLVVGFLFVSKSFIWSFVLTYVLLRVAAPIGLVGALFLSLWSGGAAAWSAERRERRQLLV
jgi:hypothetical protein